MEDIPSHDSSSIQSEGEVPAESEKSNQQLNLINNSNSNLNELNNVSNNGPEAFMKTDDLIDLFSIDPATGRAKVEEGIGFPYRLENDNIFGDIENHDYNDTKEDNFEGSLNCLFQQYVEFYNDLNPFEEIKQHKAIDDFEFEFKDPEVRREIPIEEFNPSSVQIHNNPTKEEKHTLKFKNFEMEKWVDRDVSETSSQRGRTSILSSESNSKVLEII